MLCTHEYFSLRFEASAAAEPPQKYREIKYHAIDRHTGKKEEKKEFYYLNSYAAIACL